MPFHWNICMKYNHKTSDVKIEINKCGGLNSTGAWPFHHITQSYGRHSYCQSALISYYAVSMYITHLEAHNITINLGIFISLHQNSIFKFTQHAVCSEHINGAGLKSLRARLRSVPYNNAHQQRGKRARGPTKRC